MRPDLPRPARPLCWWLLLLACCGLSALGATVAHAAPTESAVKAAFLFRMAGLVEWPSGTFQRPDEPLVIAVAGQESIASDLEQIVAGRAIEERAVRVRRLRDAEGVPDGVHVLMIGNSREARVRELANTPGPLLVVTEQENGHALGAVLNFVPDRARVRFSASLSAAEARGLRLSARLLAVAVSVEGRK